MFNCLVVDDEKLARETITLLVKKHCKHLKIIGEAWDKKSILSSISSLDLDVIFLDIQLGQDTIFELISLKDVRHLDVVFTTAYSNFAMKGYDLSPLDYILKPITKEQLQKVEDKLILKYKDDYHKNTSDSQVLIQNRQTPIKLKIVDRNGLHLLEVNNIMYCIGEGSYTTFYVQNGSKYLISKNLKVYEDKLINLNFFRVHKSCLINFDHITSINKADGGAVIMSDEKVILLSKRKKQQLLETIDRLTL